ncbi:hypothetical protein QC763_303660 [Podospora pseudopauciseta]|uniref:Uncharacterized protein n=1 Tax=Podospora pseudopauciseta TaxID=2093780 RepID=A0ABR0HFL6_9PEZI|nr:hypothetical protein QC763_303660 [Podospora pseudopauciseta]
MSAPSRQGRPQAPSPFPFRILDDRNNRQDVKPLPPRRSNGSPPPGSRRNITTSMSSFFNKLRPSKRPERGGTIRHKRNSSSSADGQKGSSIPVPAASSAPSGVTGPRDSDIIPASRWNMPIPIPHRMQSTRAALGKQPASSLPRLTINTSALKQDKPHPVEVDRRDWAPRGNATAKKSNIPTAQPTMSTGDTREIYLAKQELRQQRRTLKQSGDFLGVTSINPHTGVMDVITPTTSSEDATVSSPTDSHLAALAHTAQDAREAYVAAKTEAQIRKEHQKAERRKEAARTVLNQHGGNVVWRKEGEAWACVAEPDLSPIPQSQRSVMSPDTSDSEATTVHRTPVSAGSPRGPFLGKATAVTASQANRPALRAGDTSLPAVSTRHQHHHQTRNRVDGNAETAKLKPHTLPRPKSLGFSLPPTVPRRVASGHPETNKSGDGQSEEQPDRGSFRQRWLRYSLPGNKIPPRITSSKPLELENVKPADLWAARLLDDLSRLDESNQAHTTAMGLWGTSSTNNDREPRFAYTPITTTTGSERGQPPPFVDGRPCVEPVDEWRDGPRSPMTMIMEGSSPASLGSLTRTPSSVCLEVPAFPLGTQPNNSPSDGESETLTTVATSTVITELEVAVLPSARDLLPTPEEPKPETAFTSLATEEPGPETPEEKTAKLDGDGDGTEESEPREMRKTMRKEKHGEGGGTANTQSRSPSWPKSTSTLRPRPHHQSPAQEADEELDHAIARGAARAALTHLVHDPKTESQALPIKEPTSCDRTRAVPVPVSASAWFKGTTTMSDRHRRLPHGAEAKAKAAAEPEGDRQDDQGQGLAPLETTTLAGDRNTPTVTKGGVRWFERSLKVGDVCREVVSWMVVVLNLVVGLVEAHWGMVKPVFDGESELRRRFELAQSTWEDVWVGVGAVVFLFGVLCVGMWLVRGVLTVLGVVKAVGRGLSVVAGF